MDLCLMMKQKEFGRDIYLRELLPLQRKEALVYIPTIKKRTIYVRVPICQSAYYQKPYLLRKRIITPKVGSKDLVVPGLHTMNSWGLQDARSQSYHLLCQLA